MKLLFAENGSGYFRAPCWALLADVAERRRGDRDRVYLGTIGTLVADKSSTTSSSKV